MATKRMSILGMGTVPRSAGVAYIAPVNLFATTAPWSRLVLVYPDTATRDGIEFGFTVPKDYVGNAKFIVVWSTSATSGGFREEIDYRAVGGDDTESLNQASAQESLTNTDTAPSAAWERMESSITATAGNFAVDDEVSGTLFRDGTDAGDTIASNVLVWDLLFEYTDV